MSTLVDMFAVSVGWNVCEYNVIVEGTSDVELLWLAAAMYYERHKLPILGDRIAILAAGKGNDGGVDGVNRRLNAARQIANADRGPDGAIRHHFKGLYDNDRAGRRAVDAACSFDRRLMRCEDVFLLSPVMPLANGADPGELRRRFDTENRPFRTLDWELEDLISVRMLSEFGSIERNAILSTYEVSGRRHTEFTREGKSRLHAFLKANASLDDLVDVVKLIRALRDYCRLNITHIEC